MTQWITVLGGAHSGKTDFVTEVCQPLEDVGWWGTATDLPQDTSWHERLDALKAERKPSWQTFDGPWTWTVHARETQSRTPFSLFVMDSLNLWLAAQIHRGTSLYSFAQLKIHLEVEFAQLCTDLATLPCRVLIVSAEAGSGVVPSGEAGRLFRDCLTRWNRQIVERSEHCLSLQAGRAFLWPGGKTHLPPEGVVVRCVASQAVSLLLGGR
jgi:adenosylcobinamide kinase/adenosylcobinamide-phosphate guanylyltransferase